MSDTIEALHPDPGKSSTRVNRVHYEAYRRALLAVIPQSRRGVAFGELPDLVAGRLPEAVLAATRPKWWVTTVKLDLEARGLIERVEGESPQRLRRVKSA